MENWTALPKKDLMMELFMAEQELEHTNETFWNSIKCSPEIWHCKDVIDDNFWVIAKWKTFIVWYNDIEEGFNLSSFKRDGEFLQYQASKQGLNEALKKLKQKI
ncbi:MAG TPA: hypothetical protein VIG94_11540 [Faecalibacter sp.]